MMTRVYFANIRIRNKMLDGIEGGFSKHYPSEEILPIYDLAMKYKEETLAGCICWKRICTGSSRDWAAKGTLPVCALLLPRVLREFIAQI